MREIYSKNLPVKPDFRKIPALVIIRAPNKRNPGMLRAPIPRFRPDDCDFFRTDHQPYHLHVKTDKYTQ